MMDEAEERAAIIASMFSKNKDIGDLEQTYVSHLKVWQEAGGEGEPMQCRYIVLSEDHYGSAFLRKSKLHSDGAFSVRKTLRLAELRSVEVSSPYLFNLLFTRTYKWRSETRADQARFLETLVNIFRKVTNGQIALQLKGLHDFDALSDSALPLSSSPQIDSKSLSSTSNCNETPRRQILDPHNDSVELAPAIYPTPPTQSSSTIPRKQDLADQGPAIHSASCYFCDSRIVGDRYKCLDCPDFDSCSTCFVITPQQHPDHAFVRIKAPGDHIRAHSSSKPMHATTCNGCSTTIYGCRFKCMHPECPDYDLCENCEALPIPVHPALHPMLKIKIPGTLIPTVCSSRHGETLSQPKSSTGQQEKTTVIPELEFGDMDLSPMPTTPNPFSNPFTTKDDQIRTPKRRVLFAPVAPIRRAPTVQPLDSILRPETISQTLRVSGTIGSFMRSEGLDLIDNFQPGVSLTNTNLFADMPLPETPRVSSASAASFGAVAHQAASEIPSPRISNLTRTKPTKPSQPLQLNTDDPSIAIGRSGSLSAQLSHGGLAEASTSFTDGQAHSSTAQSKSGHTLTSLTEEDNISDVGSDIHLVSVPSSPIDDDDEGLFRESRSHISPAATASSNSRSASGENSSVTDYVLVDDTACKY